MGTPARLSQTIGAHMKYHHAAGLGAANVPFLAGGVGAAQLLTAAAWCSAPGASVQVTAPVAGPVVPIPPGGSVTIDFDGALGSGGPPGNVAFVGTDGYFLDWVEGQIA